MVVLVDYWWCLLYALVIGNTSKRLRDLVLMKTVSVLKKYAALVSTDELAKLEAEIVSSLPRFFENSNCENLVIHASDLDWKVSKVDGEDGELLSTLYAVRAFGMVDFFAIDEVAEDDLSVVLYSHLA